MGKAVMNDLLVLLPGITGSVLRRDGRDVWNVSGRALRSAALTLGDSIRSLTFAAAADDPEADCAPDGVEAAAMIDDAHLIPGL
jgi:hypothetical protein